MDGLSRLSNIGPSIALDGKLFSVQGRTLRHYAEIEAQILSFRPHLGECLHLATKGLGRDDARELAAQLITECKKQWCVVDSKESYQWRSNSWEGRLFSLWLAIRHHGYRQDETDAMACSEFGSRAENNEEKWYWIESAIDQATGDDMLSRIDKLDGMYSSSGSPMPWPLVYHQLVRVCGLDPDNALDLTFGQAQVLLKDERDLRYGGGKLDSPAEVKSWQRQLREKEFRLVDEFLGE